NCPEPLDAQARCRIPQDQTIALRIDTSFPGKEIERLQVTQWDESNCNCVLSAPLGSLRITARAYKDAVIGGNVFHHPLECLDMFHIDAPFMAFRIDNGSSCSALF